MTKTYHIKPSETFSCGGGSYDTEKVDIQFSGNEMNKILEYQEHCGAETVQEAIMIAVSAKQ